MRSGTLGRTSSTHHLQRHQELLVAPGHRVKHLVHQNRLPLATDPETSRNSVDFKKLLRLPEKRTMPNAPASRLQDRLLCVCRALVLVVAGIPAIARAQEQPVYEAHVIVVQFEPGIIIGEGAAKTGLELFDRVASRYRAHTVERAFPFLDHVQPTPKTEQNLAALRRTYYVRYSADANPALVAKTLAAVPGVTYAEPIAIPRLSELDVAAEPNDPSFSDQTYLRHMRLPEAWDIVKGKDSNPPVVIAIVDGGGNWRHEDLLANVWTNPDEIPDNGIDDDSNGFIDDVHGANLCDADDTNNDPYNPEDGWHGTLVAGAAGAVTDNGTGLAGAAWNADLMHICGNYDGILYAAANGASIINTSWFTPRSDEERRMEVQILNLATDMGALVVAAASNGGRNVDEFAHNPYAHSRVLSVGATRKDARTKASFSNYGKRVNVFAPGEGIITTAHDGDYTISGGTSLAAPLVSGVAALVKTRFPDLSPDALREQLRLSSENMDGENLRYEGLLGRGYVNAEAALKTPAVPAVRVKRWSWTDTDGNGQISSGDDVRIRATVTNYLAEARQLTVGLIAAESYPYIDITTAGHAVGLLASGDSAEVRFQFRVASDAPVNRRVFFHTRVRDGAFVDEADLFFFVINRRLDVVYAVLSALYASTDGYNWRNNYGWDFTRVPTPEQLEGWFGVTAREGIVQGLRLKDNNLTGQLPPEVGSLSNLLSLELANNSLAGEIPRELGNLSKLTWLDLSNNALSGKLPRSLMQLTNLYGLFIHGQGLCVPWDYDFRAWLDGIPIRRFSKCVHLTKDVEDQTFTMGGAVALHLPGAVQGAAPYSYTLDPALPPGLIFNGATRTVSGVPTETANQVTYTYTVTDANAITDSLTFGIEVVAGVSFADVVVDQLFLHAQPITPLVLPEAAGGVPPIAYTLTPTLPAGLAFDAATRSLSGSPTMVTAGATPYTYKATGTNGSADSLTFSIEVVAGVSFADMVADQSFPRAQPITPLVLPEAAGGVPPIAYTLTPTLPAGLAFDAATRSLSGTPTMVTAGATPYTYKATGTNGSADSLTFSIQVYSPVSAEQESLPEAFAMHGSYPNPFRHATRLVFDLPWPARMTVEVLDVVGRRVLSVPGTDLAAGWKQSIELVGAGMPSGLYLYRVHASSPEGSAVHVGRFMRIR